MPHKPYQNGKSSFGAENELVEACLQGNRQAQRFLFEKFYGKMLGVCKRYSRGEEEAKDILQDGFVKVFQKLEQYKSTSPLEPWLRRIMVNTAIDHYRKNLAEPAPLEADSINVASEDADVLSDMSHAELLECLQQLPAGYKLIFNMYAIEGYSHREIAEALEISEGTSKSQLAKAKIYLQKMVIRRFAIRNGIA